MEPQSGSLSLPWQLQVKLNDEVNDLELIVQTKLTSICAALYCEGGGDHPELFMSVEATTFHPPATRQCISQAPGAQRTFHFVKGATSQSPPVTVRIIIAFFCIVIARVIFVVGGSGI